MGFRSKGPVIDGASCSAPNGDGRVGVQVNWLIGERLIYADNRRLNIAEILDLLAFCDRFGNISYVSRLVASSGLVADGIVCVLGLEARTARAQDAHGCWFRYAVILDKDNEPRRVDIVK